MNTGIDKTIDSILGYRLLQKIGSGGFGEVWKAEAPGGISKAIKLLHGCQGDRRANLELRSLERVKQLRHPFLLSLERIEFVDDLLVIVTELADQSMGDLFEAYAQRKIVGIPREELLGYLSEVAQALDFLALEHNLQHLDVKPENFLLVGQHAKLADFGLVKELQNSGQSLLGGMTPTYAAPELFDGCPSRTSDQYSLAIVFQEMLTGERPFSGGSAAQLASQHLHGKPNLSRLPANDQKILAKALNKDPEKRYKSCIELIDELRQKKTLVSTGKKQIVGQRAPQAERTTRPERAFKPAVTQPISEPLQVEATPPRFAPAPDIDSSKPAFSPLLIIGVGQLGTQVVRSFKARVEQQFGSLSEFPAIGLLAIDSDRVALSEAIQSGNSDSLDYEQTLHLPLRRPEAYRDSTRNFTKWLNRRWIYNVPKSLQTEGLRPLGRLALVDNFNQLWTQMQRLAEQVTQRDAIAQTIAKLDLDPQAGPPRIFVVGSMSGGIGSGTLLDLAYLCRILLQEQGYSGNNVHGMILHSTESQGRDAGLNVANSFAFLTELRQYMRDGYPGEASCGVPELPGEPPFDHIYLQPLESFEDSEQLQAKLSQLANYLVLSNLTPGQPFFEACRQLDESREAFSFRSFGMSMLGLGYSADTQRITAALIQPILARWCGQDPQSPKEVPDFANLIPSRELAERTLEVAMRRILPRHLVNKAMAEALQNPGQRCSDWRLHLDQLFGFQDEDNPEQFRGDGQVDVKELVEEVFSDCYLQLRQTVQQDFDSNRLDLNVASWKWAELQRIASTQMQEAPQHVERLTRTMLELEHTLDRQLSSKGDRSGDRVVLISALENYTQIRFRHLAAVCNQMLQRRLLRAIEEIRADVERIRLRISAAVKSYQLGQGSPTNGLDEDAELQLKILQSFEHELLSRIELRFYHEQVVPRGSFWEIARDAAGIQSQLLPALFTAAAHEVAEAARTLRPEHLSEKSSSEESLWNPPIRQLLAKCQPFSERLGGEARLLLGVPKGNDAQAARHALEQQAGIAAAAVNLNSSDLVLISEVDGISFADLAVNLLCERSDCLELANRLMVRSDVRWSSLQDLL